MKAVVVLATVVLAVSASLSDKEYQNRFQSWLQAHRKSYNHEQYQFRFSIFKQNTDFIESHNAAGHSYQLGMNQFGDLTNKEYRRLYLGFNATFNYDPEKVQRVNVSVPASWDWRKYGAVTPVKDQAQCGSCWAFSTTGTVEGCHSLSGKALTSLSEQQLMDCSWSYGNQGCNGGLMTSALDYIIANKGVDTEDSYPYTAKDGTCKYNPANVGAKVGSYVNVKAGDETDLLAKATVGPVSVAIDAGQASFQFYKSGVYNDPGCSSRYLNHGVLAIGWDTDATSGSDYYIVKNSWGTSWGNQGLIWMSRNKNNQCGIATMASLAQNC